MVTKWKKVLYKRQNYPDNYVDPSFLSEMRKNVNLYNFSWTEAVIGVCPLTHEICCTVLFFLTFVFLQDEDIFMLTLITSPDIFMLLYPAVLYTVICYEQKSWPSMLAIFKYVKSGVFFLSVGYLFAPVLKNLTETISTDTIYAMVAVMLIIHVLLQDYGADASIVSTSLSFNSAIFAAVCLSSRLQTVAHTFILMIYAAKTFVILPLIRQKMVKSYVAILFITAVFAATVLGSMYVISKICTVLLFLLFIFINIVCPTAFVYCQRYKETIFGPWDEAIVKEHDKVEKKNLKKA